MVEERYRPGIRPLVLEGISRRKIKERLDAAYDDYTSEMTIVKNWFNESQCGRTSLSEEPRPGAPKTATTEDNVTKNHHLVLAGCRLKMREKVGTTHVKRLHA